MIHLTNQIKACILVISIFTIGACNKCEFHSNPDRITTIFQYEKQSITATLARRYALNPSKIAPHFYRAEKINNNFNEVISLLHSDTNKQKIFTILNENVRLMSYLRDSSIIMRLEMLKEALEINDLNCPENIILINELNYKMLISINASIDRADYKFNRMVPLVIPENNIIRKGETYKADIYMTAYDTTRYPSVKFMNENIPVNLGVAKLAIIGNSRGIKSFSGELEWLKEDMNVIVREPFEVKFEVK